ncbi:hypothetical protein BKA64DRAFT_674940 [Cadophora sp. MPI-SDFR-AT-0126]|nr:hypothetical protein BKA64DRAFT_674940 [Leotiomycetes sp. MPI-SDFR-AT-0126]
MATFSSFLRLLSLISSYIFLKDFFVSSFSSHIDSFPGRICLIEIDMEMEMSRTDLSTFSLDSFLFLRLLQLTISPHLHDY